MTLEQWQALKVGDRIVDKHHRGAVRTIHAIKRNRGKPSQRGLTRTALTVTNLKSSSSRTVLFESENTGPDRFDLFVPVIAPR